MILLTAWTPPPEGFPSKDPKLLESARTWSQVARWILDHGSQLEPSSRALAADLLSFLKEKNLLDRHFNTRDLSAFTFYAMSEDAFRYTFCDVMKAIATAHLELGPYKVGSVGIDGSLGSYIGWIYLNPGHQTGGSKFWVGAGVCAGFGEGFDEGLAQVTRNEPFFFVYLGDEYLRRSPVDLVSTVPQGWHEMKARPALIATKPVRGFSDEPDRRAVELAWSG